MKILWVGNYTTQSSYAGQARLIVPRLIQHGHEVAVLEIGGNSNTPRQVENVLLLPTFHDKVGNDCVAAHAARFGAHAVITCFDTWAADEAVYKSLNWIAWTPVDHMPVPPLVAQRVRHAKIVAGMSAFGCRQLRAALPDATVLHVPCAYDPNVWFPPDAPRPASAAFPTLPANAFLVTFVGVNDSVPSRKSIPEILAAWKLFSDAHPDAYLYLHTSAIGNLPLHSAGGVDIERILETFRINPQSVLMPDAYTYATGVPQARLREIAHSTNVLLSPSKGEGFGLVPLEFQACGVPCIVNNFSAQPELCFDGWLTEGELTWTWQSATWQTPGIASIIEALESAYAERHTPRAAERRATVARRAQAYAVDTVFVKHWLPLLERAAEIYLETRHP